MQPQLFLAGPKAGSWNGKAPSQESPASTECKERLQSDWFSWEHSKPLLTEGNFRELSYFHCFECRALYKSAARFCGCCFPSCGSHFSPFTQKQKKPQTLKINKQWLSQAEFPTLAAFPGKTLFATLFSRKDFILKKSLFLNSLEKCYE